MISAVDTHCHLDMDMFEKDRDQVLRRALDSGVHSMLLIGFNPDRWESTAALSERHPFLLRAVGLHPTDASLWTDDLERRMRSEVEASSPVAVGEIGMDFYRSSDNREQQLRAFERQVEIAQEYDLPIIIHQRSAENEVLEVLDRHRPVRGVMHCFTGGSDFAGKCLDIGMHLGIGGVVTFPKSEDLRTTVASVPLDRILLETDAPFLAPQRHRGKRNESAYVMQVAETLADCRGVSIEFITAQTTRNATELFGQRVANAVQSGMEFQ